MEARITYRQLGKPMLVMCEKPKRMEAVHQPASWLFEARESMFCNRPRKRNSSGHAVKKKMPKKRNGSDFNCDHCGANSMKCMPWPSGIAMQLNTTKLATMKKLQRLPQPIE